MTRRNLQEAGSFRIVIFPLWNVGNPGLSVGQPIWVTLRINGFLSSSQKEGVDFVFVPVRFFDIFVGLCFCVCKLIGLSKNMCIGVNKSVGLFLCTNTWVQNYGERTHHQRPSWAKRVMSTRGKWFEPRKKPRTFHYTGCLIGILII